MRHPRPSADHSDMPALALQSSVRPAAPEQHRTAGQRLLEAFEALEHFPIYAGVREALSRPGTDTAAVVESDLALTMAVLREANRGQARTRIGTVPAALDRIGDLGLHAVVASAPSFDFFDETGPWGSVPRAYRFHAQGTQRAAERLARVLHHRNTDELRVAVLLH